MPRELTPEKLPHELLERALRNGKPGAVTELLRAKRAKDRKARKATRGKKQAKVVYDLW
jgi:hypothetical protein